MLSPAVQSGLFAFLLVCVLVAAFVRRSAFLFMAGFLIPLMTPRLNLVIGVDWYKVLGPVAGMLWIVRGSRGRNLRPRELNLLSWWLLYCTVVSIAWMVVEYTVLHRYWLAEAMGLGAGQSVFKMPVQLASFIVVGMCAWIVPWHAEREKDIESALRGMAWGIGTSVTFGVLLLLLTGRGMLSPGERRGIIEVGSTEVGRVGGLTGEPKMLGAVLVIGIVTLLCRLTFKRTSPTRRWEIGFLVLFAAGLFATYSTSAWVALGVGLTVLLYLAIRFFQYSRTHRLIAAVLVALSLGATTPTFWNALEERLTGRLIGDRSELARQKDNFLWEALDDKPIHGIWGFGFGGTDLEVIPYVPASERAYRRTPTAAVTGMRLLGDTGVVGLLGLIGLLLVWSRRLRALGDPEASAFVVAGGAAALSCSINALPCFLFIAGAYWVRTKLRSASKEEPRPAPASLVSVVA